MRKIDLRAYKYKSGLEEKDYDIKANLLAVLFNRQLGLSAKEVDDRGELADKIQNCNDDELLLEESEFEPIKQAFQKVRGFGSNDRKLIRRIFGASKIEVKEKK